MILKGDEMTKLNEKEYEWEILPYADEATDYHLWVTHHKDFPIMIHLSNTQDTYEDITLTNKRDLEALIESLQKAKEIFK